MLHAVRAPQPLAMLGRQNEEREGLIDRLVEPVGRCGGLLRAHRVDQSRQAGTCFLPRGSRPRVAQPREQVGAQRVRADIGECVADVVDLAAASGK